MAGKGVELLVSPTEDETKVLASFAKISMAGSSNFVTAVQIAELALKHRKNKHGSQRIVIFVGSPLKDDIPILEKVGKQLRKNNVGVDVISMGEVEENSEKLTAFVNSAHSEGNSSHLIVVPPGVIPCDALLSSPVLHMGFGAFGGSGGGGASAGAGASAFEEFGGIDPNLDPDLAMAIRLSAEEARATEEARASAAMNESLENSSAVIASSPQGGAVNPTTPVPFGGFGAEDDEDEEALMQQALALSLRDTQIQENTSSSSAVNNNEMEIDDDEAALQAALAMSLPQPPQAPTQLPPQAAEGFVDPAFVNQLLGSTMNTDINSLNEILGSVDVDINDPLIQAALAQMAKANQDDKEKDNQNKK